MTDFAEAGAHLPAEIINEVIASKNGRVATFDDLEIDYPTPIPGISLVWVEDEQTMRLWDGDDWLIIGRPEVRAHASVGLNTISATSYADLPTNPLSVSVTVAVATRVKIELRSINFGTTTGSILAGIALSGATTSAADSPDDSVIMYATTAGRGNSAVKIITLQPGTTTIKAQAYQAGGGTNTMNYSQLIVNEF